MYQRQRHCLAKSVTRLVAKWSEPPDAKLSKMIDAACQCAEHHGCELKTACKPIHEAFMPKPQYQ
jgi:hypothetical protein